MGAQRRGHQGVRKPIRWNDETLRAELQSFIGDRTSWPTASEFASAGREDLRNAVKRRGGATWWAEQMGVNLRPQQERSPYGEEQAIRDARELVNRLGHVPGMARARALGFHRFATHLRKSGGSVAFARMHQLPASPYAD